MDLRYNFEERIKRIERKLMMSVIFSISLGIAVGLVNYIYIASYQLTLFLAFLVMSMVAIAATAFLIYREMDEVEDEDLPALIREKVMHVAFAMIAGYMVVTYLYPLML